MVWEAQQHVVVELDLALIPGKRSELQVVVVARSLAMAAGSLMLG